MILQADSYQNTDSQIGEFWIPNQPGIRVSGLLSRRGNGAEISLLGHLGSSPEVILGSVKNVGRVTILQCHATSMPVGGFADRDTFSYQATYKGLYLLTGGHLSEGWDSLYQAITIEIPEIDIWSDEWRSRIISDSESNALRVTTLAKDSARDFACEILSIVVPDSWSIGDRSETLKRVTRCDFLFHKAHTAQFLYDFAFRIRDLITVLLGRPVEIAAMTFENPVEHINQDSADSHSAELLIGSQHGTVHWVTGFDKPLVPLELIKDKWGGTVSKWLDLYSKVQLQIWLFLSGSYELRSYSHYEEIRVLALVQALESFHRSLYDHPKLPHSAQEARTLEIISHLPPEHHEWANRALSLDNQISLSQRLDELLSRISPLDGKIFRKPKQFKHKLVKTRNFYSHYDPESTKGRLGHDEMHAAILMCSMFLESLFLTELDFPIDVIAERIPETRKYKDLLFQREHYGIRF